MAASRIRPHALFTQHVRPLITVASLSIFVRIFYNFDYQILWLLVKAMVIFVSFFVSFYFSLVVFKSYFHYFCEGDPNERHFTTVIAYCVSLLAITEIVCNVLPVNLGLEYLLPLAVALIFWKADAYLRVLPTMDMPYALFGLCVVVLPSAIIQSIFYSIFKF
ncbi:MAG: hypothetical protein K2K05_11935 [Muribaculaceae bacterium]|nr:hypothetical protein [Muribaculaceae bacterium]